MGIHEELVAHVQRELADFEALQIRAAAIGIKPSVLARNLIRGGLAERGAVELPDIVRELESAVAELRTLVPE